MDVDVDEAGADDLAGGVDDRLRGRPVEPADRHDAPTRHADVGRSGRLAPRAIDNVAAADQQIELHSHPPRVVAHRSATPRAITASMEVAGHDAVTHSRAGGGA
jgi:hypothetical protein